MTSEKQQAFIFMQMKIACNQVLQAPSIENIDNLSLLIKDLPVSEFETFHNHLFFILLQLLNKNLGSEIKLHTISCLENAIFRCKIFKDDALLNGLLLCLMGIVYDPVKDHLVTDLPEELHLTCVRSLILLLKRSSPELRTQLYLPRRAPALGVLVCVCLKIANKQQLRPLKVAALELLMACGQVLEQAEISDPYLKNSTANVFMNFTPGIAAGLQQVICADQKQGHAVVVVAVRAWGRLLAQVLDEESVPPEALKSYFTSTPQGLTNLPSKELSSTESFASVQTCQDLERLMSQSSRTPAWMARADTKLVQNVKAVSSAHQHSHPRVRLELVKTVQLLLTKCSRSIPQCVPHLLEVLLILSEDEDNEVAKESSEGLKMVSLKCEVEQGQGLKEILEESFYNNAIKIPSIFNSTDLRDQQSSLNLLLGHLRLLGPRLQEALLLAPHLEALLQALLQASMLSCGGVMLLADTSLKDVNTDYHEKNCSRPWVQYHHFSDGAIESKLMEVYHTLGKYADLRLVSSQLLHVFCERAAQRREAIFLLNEIFSLEAPEKHAEHFKIVKSVLKAYLDPNVWDAPLSMDCVQKLEDAPLTLVNVRGNVVQACLLVEGLGRLGAAVGSYLRQLLSLLLYPILERAGSSQVLVSQAGRQALSTLAQALGHCSSSQLIQKEASYFTHQVALNLRRQRENPSALLVLSAVLAHSSMDVLPCIEDIINNVLVWSYDTFQDGNLYIYLQVFHTFILNVLRWLDVSESEPLEVESLAPDCSEELSPLVQELQIHHKWKLACGEFGEEDEADGREEEPVGETKLDEGTGKTVPNYIKMTECVMHRCIQTLSSPVRERQLIALRTLKKGIKVLEPWEDQLLPMVHRIWSPLLQRFSPNQDIVILRQSFELLCVMARAAKDFLRKRTLQKVLPSIANFLSKQAEVNKKQRGKVQPYSQVFKLQQTALQRLGPLAEDLQLQEEDLDLIMTSTVPFLSAQQPLVLQESCVSLFQYLSRMDPDAVWLKMLSVWNPEQELHISGSGYSVIRLPRETLEAKEYEKNVEIIRCMI